MAPLFRNSRARDVYATNVVFATALPEVARSRRWRERSCFLGEPYGNEVRSNCHHPHVLLTPSACSFCPLSCTTMTSTFVARRGVLAAQPRPMEVERSGTLPCLCFHPARLVLTMISSRRPHNRVSRGGLYAALPSPRSR